MHVSAEKLSISSTLDWVELENQTGSLKPVEDKRGNPKLGPMDEIQLCAQGLCLKEMMEKQAAKVCRGIGKLATASIVFVDDLRSKISANIVPTRERLNSG